METLPVSIISGYLGAGKTTLVNHLLRNPAGKRLAILVNEFGDLAIDADLIQAQDDEMISLAGGCVCCSYGSGLIEAFLKLKSLDTLPDHVILEASGVAIPSAIAGSLSVLDLFKLDSIICLIDAFQIEDQIANPYLEDTIARQMNEADLIVVNKIDLLAVKERSRLNQLLKQKFAHAQFVETEYAAAAGELVLQPFERRMGKTDSEAEHNLSQYQTYVIIPEASVEPNSIVQEILNENPKLLRAKGFVSTSTGEMKTIQIVGRRVDISDAPPNVETGIVVISLK